MRDNLEVKDRVVGGGEARKRFVLVRNSAQAERDRLEREASLKRLQEQIDAIGDLPAAQHNQAVCALVAHGPRRPNAGKRSALGMLRLPSVMRFRLA